MFDHYYFHAEWTDIDMVKTLKRGTAVDELIVITAGKKRIPVVARSKAWVCCRWLAVIAGSNPTGCVGVLSVVSVVCCQAEVSATG